MLISDYCYILLGFIKTLINKARFSEAKRALNTYGFDGFTRSLYRYGNKNKHLSVNIDKIAKLLINKKEDTNKYNILLFSHELSYTGAPIMLLKACESIIKLGGHPIVISYSDGPLKAEFEKLNIPVLIGGIFHKNKTNIDFLKKYFNLIIANTALTYEVSEYFEEYIPVIWWIHEAQSLENEIFKIFPAAKIALNKAKNVYTVSNYAMKYVSKYNSNTQLLRYGFKDELSSYANNINEKIIFSMVGQISDRKNQKLFIDTILNLPDKYKNKAIFNIIGKKDNDLGAELENKTKNIPGINFLGEIRNKYELIKQYEQTHVLVCISDDDPDPLVVIEGFMHKCVCIVSKNTGQAELIENNKNGFILQNNNIENLKTLLIKIIENSQNLYPIADLSRKIYIDNYSIYQFEEQWKTIIQKYNPIS